MSVGQAGKVDQLNGPTKSGFLQSGKKVERKRKVLCALCSVLCALCISELRRTRAAPTRRMSRIPVGQSVNCECLMQSNNP